MADTNSLKECPACGTKKCGNDYSSDNWSRSGFRGRCKECVKNKVQLPEALPASRWSSRRRAVEVDDDGADGAADAAYGQTPLSVELLRVAGGVNAHFKGDPVGGLMTYCRGKSLKSVDDLAVHYVTAADRVREAICGDASMAFSSLAFTLCRVEKLMGLVSSINAELFETVPGAKKGEMKPKTHLELLELLGQVCAQYEKEEPLRISSKYKLAIKIVEEDDETSPADLKRITVRGDVYVETSVCDTCVPLCELNNEVLGEDFDPKLHLAPGAKDFSREGFVYQLAAEPGPESRLALTKIAQVQLGVLSDLKLDSTRRLRHGGAAGTPSPRGPSTRSFPRRILRFST